MPLAAKTPPGAARHVPVGFSGGHSIGTILSLNPHPEEEEEEEAEEAEASAVASPISGEETDA